MKLSDLQSSLLLPRFAESISWVNGAFDIIVRDTDSRSISLDSPLTKEAIRALTDEELQAYYTEYGIAIYYPDLSRTTRDDMLYEMARIYRFIGTPYSIELLCNYIFDESEAVQVTIKDNIAWNSDGTLIDSDLLDLFDLEVTFSTPDYTPEKNARILENVFRFSRNSQTLRDTIYIFSGEMTQPVGLAHGEYAGFGVEYVNYELCVLPPLTYIVTDSTGSIIWGGDSSCEFGLLIDRNTGNGQEILSAMSPINVGNSDVTYGSGEYITSLDIDTTFGASVTIPSGYRVDYVKSTRGYAFGSGSGTGTEIFKATYYGKDIFSTDITPQMIGASVIPALLVFQVTEIIDGSLRGYRLSSSPSYNVGVVSSFSNVMVNQSPNVFIQFDATMAASYSITDICVSAINNGYPSTFRVQFTDGVDADYFLNLPAALWSFTNGEFVWTEDSTVTSNISYFYKLDNAAVRIHCVLA